MKKVLTKADLSNLSLEKEKLAAQRKLLLEGLPHLYGLKHYAWSKAFFESLNKMNLLTAANQIGKSHCQIRKAIHWATSPKLWPTLWITKPKQLWYFYPDNDTIATEFRTKWEPDLLPRNSFIHHPVYGYNIQWESRQKYLPHSLHFNSGVSLIFKTYSQRVTSVQASTVHGVFADEEMPEDFFDEINLRLAAVDGYFHMVATPTLNQQLWYRALEGTGKEELFPDAWKRQVSMYDCLTFEDGSPSHWSVERIKEIEAKCSSEAEIQRRVYGRFITDRGRVYSSFNPDRHYIAPFRLSENYQWYAAVDCGSGGGTGHPAAIVFVAVAPDFSKGYVARAWRGDTQQTTASDILEKYREIRGGLHVVQAVYDYSAKDFGIISQRIGETFQKAEKSHDIGISTINSLLRNDALILFDEDEIRKLGGEWMTVKTTDIHTKSKDDLADACRYCCAMIPWDWSKIDKGLTNEVKPKVIKILTEREQLAEEINKRREAFEDKAPEGWAEMNAEFKFWDDLAGNG